MKKILSLMLLVYGASFGMRQEYTHTVNLWAKYGKLYEQCLKYYTKEMFEERSGCKFEALEKKRDASRPPRFDFSILSALIFDDIDQDPVALQVLRSCLKCKFGESVDFYRSNFANISPENAEKLKEVFILLASIINTQRNGILEPIFLWQKNYKEYINKIFSICGGDPSTVTFRSIQFPQHCFEIFMLMSFESENSAPGAIFQAINCILAELMTPRYNWNEKKGETAIYNYSRGRYEDNGGQCFPWDVWLNWRE
jgi:hypothetical protein